MIAPKTKTIIIPLIFCLFLTAALILITFPAIRKESDNISVKRENTVWNALDIKIDMNESDAVISSYDEYEGIDYPLIAADPENNILLYGVKPQGVVLFKGGTGQFFDWSYLTPLGILPELTTADFDGDGIDEIGINLYWGEGTGMSLEQLHIVKPAKNKSGSDCFLDYEFMADDYAAQLTELLQYGYDSDTKMLMLQVQDKSYKIMCERGFMYLNCIDIVQFRFESGVIKGTFPLGIVQEGVTAEYGYGSLTANVIYEEGNFTLTELDFDETLEISLLHRSQIN